MELIKGSALDYTDPAAEANADADKDGDDEDGDADASFVLKTFFVSTCPF